jgi:hypothetical protein
MDKSVIEFAEKQAALCRVLGSARRLIILWLISNNECLSMTLLNGWEARYKIYLST